MSSEAAQRKIAVALNDTAALRGGTITKDATRLYAVRLSREYLPDVLDALGSIGELKRGDYEPAVPELGAIMAMVSAARTARMNREQAKRDLQLVSWRCVTCGHTMCGWVPTGADLERICKSTALPLSMKTKSPFGRSLPKGEVCGGIMKYEVIPSEVFS